MVFGLPQNQLFLTLDTPNYFKDQESSKSFITHVIWGNLAISEMYNFEKQSLPEIIEGRYISFDNLESGIHIFQINMKWECGISIRWN